MKVLAEEGTNQLIEEIKKKSTTFTRFLGHLEDLKTRIEENEDKITWSSADNFFLIAIQDSIYKKCKLFRLDGGAQGAPDVVLQEAQKWMPTLNSYYPNQLSQIRQQYLDFINMILDYIYSNLATGTSIGSTVFDVYNELPDMAFIYDFLTPRTTN